MVEWEWVLIRVPKQSAVNVLHDGVRKFCGKYRIMNQQSDVAVELKINSGVYLYGAGKKLRTFRDAESDCFAIS